MEPQLSIKKQITKLREGLSGLDDYEIHFVRLERLP